MSWADRDEVDEISQCDRGLRFLLKGSSSPQTQALVDYLEDWDGPNKGKMLLHEGEEDELPGLVGPIDRPCVIFTPAALSAEVWRTPQARLVHSCAVLGLIDSRISEPVNRLAMLTLRALFQRQARIPDTMTGHDPETQHLDFVQGMRLGSTIERLPIAKLQNDQGSELDEETSSGYKTWGFRILLAVELRADLLQGG